MNRFFRRHRLAILLATIMLTIAAAAVSRPAFAVYSHRKAGSLLARLTAPYPTQATCEIPPVSDPSDRDKLFSTLTLLKRAVRYEPGISHTYLLLGYASCLLDQPDQAVQAFQSYVDLRPQNPLARLELGFAQLRLCVDSQAAAPQPSSSLEPALCQDQSLLHQIQSAWLVHDIDTAQFLVAARQAFDLKNYAGADLWYQRALKFHLPSIDELPVPDQFKWAASLLLTGSPLPQALSGRLPVVDVAAPTTITPDQLRWFREIPTANLDVGSPVKVKSVDQHESGIMNWRGPVGFFINAPQAGWYQISLRAQHTLPAPVILHLEDAFQSFASFELARGDLSWQEFQSQIRLEKGIHLLTVNFTNDAVVNGVDRNAVIEWMKLRPGE